MNKDSKNRVFNCFQAVYRLIFKALAIAPTTTVLLEMGAPGTATDGLSVVLIGDFLILESFVPMAVR